MSVYGSNEELLKLLNIYKSKEYVNDNFLYFLNVYPDLLNIAINNDYCSYYFDDAIRQHMDSVIRHLINKGPFGLIFRIIEKYESEVINSLDIILDEDEYYMQHFSEIIGTRAFEKYSRKKQDKILSKALSFKEYNFPTDYTSNILFLCSALPFFEKDFAGANRKLIENFINTIANIMDPECLKQGDLNFLLCSFSESAKEHKFMHEFISNHIEYIAMCLTSKKINTLKQEGILNFYVELIKDVIRIEKADITDLKLKNGAFSRVLIVKDKVIKSGEKKTKIIPYHRRLLQPIIRQSIPHSASSIRNFNILEKVDFDFVEAYERVDSLPFGTAKKLIYEVFKEMLDDGILLADPSSDNLGILLKPNVPFHEKIKDYNGAFYIDDEVVNIESLDVEKEILDKGDIVVRDLDVVYYVKGHVSRELIEQKLRETGRFNLFDFRKLLPKDKKIVIGPEFEEYFFMYINDIKEKINAENKGSK